MQGSEPSTIARLRSGDAASIRPLVVRGLKGALALAITLVALTLPLALCLRRSLSIDEYIYLHWAYEASRGSFAGADYFATHLPFMQVLFAPAFWVERATPERGAVVARVAFALLATASVWLAFYNYDRAKGVTGTGVAPRLVPSVVIAAVSVGACDSYASRIIEVRPDNVYVFFLLLSLACFPQSRHRARSWVSGACFGCALLSSEKMVVTVVALVAAHLGAIAMSREARGALLEPGRRANARDFGLGLVLFCVLGACMCTGGNLRGGGAQMVELATYLRGRFEERRPFMANPGARGFLIVLAFSTASLGVMTVLALFGDAARERDGTRRKFAWSITYLALLAAGAVTYAIQKESYEYSRVLLFVVAVPLVVDAIATVVSTIRKPRFATLVAQWAILGALAGHGILGVGPSRQTPSLDENLAMLAELRSATTSEDCVYDNSAEAFFRDHAHSHYVMTDHLMRDTQGSDLAEQIPPAIVEHACVAMMADSRNSGMPKPLQRFLTTHFVAVSPYFYFYGTKLVTRKLDEPAQFTAPRTSWYLADPRGATVRLSEDDPWTERIWLDRGDHKVFVSRKNARLIWQPRDGAPRPPYHGRMDLRFSHI